MVSSPQKIVLKSWQFDRHVIFFPKVCVTIDSSNKREPKQYFGLYWHRWHIYLALEYLAGLAVRFGATIGVAHII